MKRTIEWILTICGMIMALLLLITGFVFLFLENKQSYLDILYNKWNDNDYALLLELMENIGIDWILPGVIAAVFGVVLMYCLKKDTQLFAIGWISIIVAGTLSFISAFGSFPAVFFIITGLIILVRKPLSTE